MKDTASNHSGGTGGTPVNTPPASASPHEEHIPVRRRSKGTRSVDERKPDRLSLFGSPFATTLGKHARKPAPKLSKCVLDFRAFSVYVLTVLCTALVLGRSPKRTGTPWARFPGSARSGHQAVLARQTARTSSRRK